MKARIEAQNPEANLRDYHQAYRTFTWAEEEKHFSLADGKGNIAYEAVDRWTLDPDKRDRPALIFEKSDQVRTFSFQDLKEKSGRLASLFLRQGLGPGDLLFIFLPPSPEIYIAMLACARLGIIFCPLYSNLNFNELEVRLLNAEPQAVLTHPDLAENLPFEPVSGLKHVFLTEGPVNHRFAQAVTLAGLVEKMDQECPPVRLPLEAPLFLIFTSGAAGPPNGVVHSHRAMLGYRATAWDVLDLGEGLTLWTDGHPAWITGTVYGAFAPWLRGAATVIQADPFSASTWYRTLERHQVSVWYTTPQRIKRLVEAGQDLPGRYDLSRLKHIATVGRSLAPDYFFWVRKNLGKTPHETWWMTETGMICLANYPSQPTKPGSMGRPVCGVEVGILDEQGDPLPILTIGELALKAGWPAMMTGIWRNERKYKNYFRFPGWFLTGDLAVRDEDGYFFHHGRNDDLLKIGDQFIGPFEVEQVLCRHPAVSEAAVISKKASTKAPFLKAFITLHQGYHPSARLNQEVREFVRANMSPEVPLLEVAFLDELPKTRTGRILRRVLRAQELGLPTHDPAGLKE
ncbi:MAG: AMP-binding protein [Thermodesulfobacteriota bacterium]